MKVTTRNLATLFAMTALTLIGCGSESEKATNTAGAVPVTLTTKPTSDAIDAVDAAGPTTVDSTTTTDSQTPNIWNSTNLVAGGIVASPEAAELIFPEDVQYSGYRNEQNRLENQLLPPGAEPANEAAKLAPWHTEPFELVYIGSKNTSPQFAEEIRKEFAKRADPTTENKLQFEAYSPTSEKTFKITCENESPDYATCRGGIGAVIYII